MPKDHGEMRAPVVDVFVAVKIDEFGPASFFDEKRVWFKVPVSVRDSAG